MSYGDEPKTQVPSTGKIAGKIGSNLTKTVEVVDKVKDTKVKKSGLLTSEEYTYLDDKGNLKPIFQERAVDSTGDTIFHDIYDYGHDALTKPAFSRAEPTPGAIERLGPQEIGDRLWSSGKFDSQDISNILGPENIEGWLQEGFSRPEVPYSIPEELMSQDEVLVGLDELDMFVEESINRQVTIPKNEIIESLNNIETQGLETQGLESIASDVSGLGIETSEVAAEAAETIEAAGTTVEVGSELAGEAAEKASALSKTLKGAGKVAEVAGQVMGGFKAAGGVEELFKKGGDKGQGVEDIIQGSISMASPWLVAAGPVGWTVLGANFLEDLFFD